MRKKRVLASPLYVFVLWCFRQFFRFFYSHRIYGLEHYVKGPAILAATHASFYDPPLVAISSPDPVHFLAREGLFRSRLFGGFIRKLNTHPIKGNVGDLTVFKMVYELLKEGDKILLFPEGKRSSNGRLSPLRPGVALLASRSEAVVLPVYVHGAFAVWPRHRLLPKPFGRTACVFGSPIYWKEFQEMPKKKGQEQLLVKLQASYEALESWFLAGAKGSPP